MKSVLMGFGRRLRFLSFCVALVAASFGISTPVDAAPINAVTFTGYDESSTSINTTRGYAFNVTAENLVATGLGMWDVGGNGLAQLHQVGLWDPSGALIASTTIPAGTSADLINGFRVVDIPDVPLFIGSGYVVGAFLLNGSTDFQAFDLTGLVTAPGITLAGARFINGVNTLTLPTTNFASNALVGGSLMVDTVTSVTPVPEPASVALFGLGLAGVVGRRWRQRRIANT